MKNKHLKPIYWGIFSIGGTTAAFALAPIILIICILLPLGLLGDATTFHANAQPWVSHWFIYLVLAGVIFTFIWHGAHRLYYVLHDFHIHVGYATRMGLYAVAVAAFVLSLIFGLL